MPWSCRHRPGNSLGEKNKVLQNEEKNNGGFHIPKIWQIVRHFAMSFHQA